MFSTTVHLPLLASKMGMFRSLSSDASIFLTWIERFEGGAFALAKEDDTFTLGFSASVSAKLLFRMVDSFAVMRSTTGISSIVTAKFKPLAKT